MQDTIGGKTLWERATVGKRPLLERGHCWRDHCLREATVGERPLLEATNGGRLLWLRVTVGEGHCGREATIGEGHCLRDLFAHTQAGLL